MSRSGCKVCDTLLPGDCIDLDLLLADPMRWPETVWQGFRPPEGGLPASYRRFGAMQMGVEWLHGHPEYSITKGALRSHLRYDVPVIDADPEALVARGLITRGDGPSTPKGLDQPIDPRAYIGLYNDGIRLGRQGLLLLEQRVNDLIAKKEDVPVSLIKMVLDAGLKLAMSQAQIVSRGHQFAGAEEEDDAFRPDESGPRFGDFRVRVIEGKARAVVDRGRADLADYNAKADEEGGIRIGGR